MAMNRALPTCSQLPFSKCPTSFCPWWSEQSKQGITSTLLGDTHRMQVCAGEEPGGAGTKGPGRSVVPQLIYVLDILGGLYIVPPFATHLWLLNLHFISLAGDHLVLKSPPRNLFTPIPKLYRQSKGFKCQGGIVDVTLRIPFLSILCDFSFCNAQWGEIRNLELHPR